MSVAIWITAGAILGVAAQALSGNRSRAGIALNVATGIVGVTSGAWLLGALTGMSAFNPEAYFLASLMISLLGATVLLTVLQLFRSIAWRENHFQNVRTDMNHRTDSRRALRPLLATGVACILMLVGACASAPPKPDSALDAARVAISNADKAGAGQYANAELAEARARLTLADNAVNDEDMIVAERFAHESQVQAELASARTEAAKAAAVNQDMERGTEAMTEEMQRAGDPR